VYWKIYYVTYPRPRYHDKKQKKTNKTKSKKAPGRSRTVLSRTWSLLPTVFSGRVRRIMEYYQLYGMPDVRERAAKRLCDRTVPAVYYVYVDVITRMWNNWILIGTRFTDVYWQYDENHGPEELIWMKTDYKIVAFSGGVYMWHVLSTSSAGNNCAKIAHEIKNGYNYLDTSI